jgi:hypothetical protein
MPDSGSDHLESIAAGDGLEVASAWKSQKTQIFKHKHQL